MSIAELITFLFLKGMLETINFLHDRANTLIKLILFDTTLLQMQEGRRINERQFKIVKIILKNHSLSLNKLK